MNILNQIQLKGIQAVFPKVAELPLWEKITQRIEEFPEDSFVEIKHISCKESQIPESSYEYWNGCMGVTDSESVTISLDTMETAPWWNFRDGSNYAHSDCQEWTVPVEDRFNWLLTNGKSFIQFTDEFSSWNQTDRSIGITLWLANDSALRGISWEIDRLLRERLNKSILGNVGNDEYISLMIPAGIQTSVKELMEEYESHQDR